MANDDIKVVGLSSVKNTGKTNWKVISAIVGIIVLSVGVIAGIVLVRQNQNINEQAACVSACPNGDNQLVNCAGTSDTDGEVSLCNSAGRIEICGQTSSTAKQYCCPSAGGNWTTNLTLCSVASTPTGTPVSTSTPLVAATSTATSTPTSTSTSTASSTPTSSSTKSPTPTGTLKATSTATAKATATSSATAFPVPETGADWPTMLGVGFGVIMILVSLALAL